MTVKGVWIATEPFRKVKSDCKAEIKGRFALEVLAASRQMLPHPVDRNEVLAPLPKPDGEKTWNDFIRHAKSLSLETQWNWLLVIPLRNLGPDEGFEFLNDSSVDVPRCSSLLEIGLAIEEAFRLCE